MGKTHKDPVIYINQEMIIPDRLGLSRNRRHFAVAQRRHHFVASVAQRRHRFVASLAQRRHRFVGTRRFGLDVFGCHSDSFSNIYDNSEFYSSGVTHLTTKINSRRCRD